MKNILDAINLPDLQPFIQPDTLLAFDYDGTLAPIVDEPTAAQMRHSTIELLQKVAARFPVAIITGRRRSDVLRFVGRISTREIIGNHGVETESGAPQDVADRVTRWKDALEHDLASVPGVVLEDKRYSISVHYRAAKSPATMELIRQATSRLPGAKLVPGKFVVNVVAVEAPDKGTSLLEVMRRLKATRCVYFGDDDTDEDAFKITLSKLMLGIRVGMSEGSAASHYVRDQEDIDELLRIFLEQ